MHPNTLPKQQLRRDRRVLAGVFHDDRAPVYLVGGQTGPAGACWPSQRRHVIGHFRPPMINPVGRLPKATEPIAPRRPVCYAQRHVVGRYRAAARLINDSGLPNELIVLGLRSKRDGASRRDVVAMQKLQRRQRQFGHLLKRDHTLNGAILLGLDGHIIEIQARATEVVRRPCSISEATSITGMATGAVREVRQRISGAFAKLGIPQSDVKILINLAPADLPKYGTWLDLPLAIIMLQASGYLPDLP